MAAIKYTVKQGDTLSEIAVTYKSTIGASLSLEQRIDRLVALNNIKDRDFIVVGQVLKLTADSSNAVKSNNTTQYIAIVDVFGLQTNTDRTMYATWTWVYNQTQHYQCIWYYDTGDNVWFIGSDSTTTDKQSIYNAPENAKRVKFKVKPISNNYTANGKEHPHWIAQWSTEHTYNFSNNPPITPEVPNVVIEKYKLTATLDNLNVNGTEIHFQVVRDNTTVFNKGKATITTNHVSYSCTVEAGSEYKVRCCSYRDGEYSEWSEYSNNIKTIPTTPASIISCKANSKTSVYLEWTEVKTADTYDIEYTTKKEYFDTSNSTTTVNSIEFTKYELTGLETGENYFFRVRAVNTEGKSSWSEIKSVAIGKEPAAPTTWSSTTTVIVGEPLTLYWIHNAEDGSSQTYADLEIYVDGVKETYTVRNSEDEDEKDKTSFFEFDTTEYQEGVKIQWRVRTAGVTLAYGDWSVQRTVDIYAPPTLDLRVTDVNGNALETLTSFPVYISGIPGPNTQQPIGYHLTVSANEMYEAIDQIGNTKTINKDELIFSKYYDINEHLVVELSAGNIDLENNISYTLTCVVTMNSGLTTQASSIFTVNWVDDVYIPNASISIDKETLTASIRPYCTFNPIVFHKVNYIPESDTYVVTNEFIDTSIEGEPLAEVCTTTNEIIYVNNDSGTDIYFCIRDSEEEVLVEDISLSVYRREFDGSFVELATGIDNTKNTYITDPHPALDYARYRIVAVSNSTGAIGYYDIVGYPIGETSVVIQWNEEWTSFDTSTEDVLEKPPWSGSLLKLPYNIDITDNRANDVTLVKYIGRKRPVTYYGTQLGETASWNMVIPKNDKDTLYALRRLSIWMGDVYVREPSGSGYWATISVSFNQKHRQLTIPITIDITRVEGGV